MSENLVEHDALTSCSAASGSAPMIKHMPEAVTGTVVYRTAWFVSSVTHVAAVLQTESNTRDQRNRLDASTQAGGCRVHALSGSTLDTLRLREAMTEAPAEKTSTQNTMARAA